MGGWFCAIWLASSRKHAIHAIAFRMGTEPNQPADPLASLTDAVRVPMVAIVRGLMALLPTAPDRVLVACCRALAGYIGTTYRGRPDLVAKFRLECCK